MTIVVGFIPNQYGRAALTAGISEARLRGLKLVVVNTSKGDSLADPLVASADVMEALEAELTTLETGYEIRQTDGAQSGGAGIAEQIVEIVRETDASLLVIGLRHRTTIGKLIMGSTAQTLLLDCPCPVLAVKAT